VLPTTLRPATAILALPAVPTLATTLMLSTARMWASALSSALWLGRWSVVLHLRRRGVVLHLRRRGVVLHLGSGAVSLRHGYMSLRRGAVVLDLRP
jgi:hypothetical protein